VSASPETKPGLVAGLFVFAAMSSAEAPEQNVAAISENRHCAKSRSVIKALAPR
jgi:hypothetical protein